MTKDEMAKDDDAVYRLLCRQANQLKMIEDAVVIYRIHQNRWTVLTGDEVDAMLKAREMK